MTSVTAIIVIHIGLRAPIALGTACRLRTTAKENATSGRWTVEISLLVGTYLRKLPLTIPILACRIKSLTS
ncbi:hypothetical protein C8R31_11063 [Nitrosospira sp. Nsp2]|nr:hypothetical protein C8R31_11063 [Nitrosospira sp. Nsp2]